MREPWKLANDVAKSWVVNGSMPRLPLFREPFQRSLRLTHIARNAIIEDITMSRNFTICGCAAVVASLCLLAGNADAGGKQHRVNSQTQAVPHVTFTAHPSPGSQAYRRASARFGSVGKRNSGAPLVPAETFQFNSAPVPILPKPIACSCGSARLVDEVESQNSWR